MGEQIPQELVDRMVALVRALAATPGTRMPDIQQVHDAHRAALEIAAQLPAPIDPDLLIAREVAAEWAPLQQKEMLSGEVDNFHSVRIALLAIKRIRSENNHG